MGSDLRTEIMFRRGKMEVAAIDLDEDGEGGAVLEVVEVIEIADIVEVFEVFKVFVVFVGAHIGVLVTEAYGDEPYAPLPGRNNRLCICADWYNSVLGLHFAVEEMYSVVTVPLEAPAASMTIARPSHMIKQCA